MADIMGQLELNFPGLFDRNSEIAKKKRENWDRFSYPPISTDSSKHIFAEFMIYAPFEEVKGTVTDDNGNLLPLYRLKVINLDSLRKETVMSSENAVRSLVADVVNEGILLDREMTRMAGIVYNVESILLKGTVLNKETGKQERKTWHKFAMNLEKSLPESERSTAGVEAHVQQLEAELSTNETRKIQDKVAVEQGGETTEQKNATEMFGAPAGNAVSQ